MADGLTLAFTGNPVLNIGLTAEQVKQLIIAAMEARMATVDDALAAIGTSVDELVKDVQRLIALFEAGGTLTAEQQAAVDAIRAKTDAIDAAVETTAPEGPPA